MRRISIRSLLPGGPEGLAENFMGYRAGSFIGHGVGLELNEMPVIVPGVQFNPGRRNGFCSGTKFVSRIGSGGH